MLGEGSPENLKLWGMIFTKTDNYQEHNKIVLEVLKRLEENDLFVKPEKCFFRVKEVEFLGMTITPDGIRMDEDKVKAVLEWPTPTFNEDFDDDGWPLGYWTWENPRPFEPSWPPTLEMDAIPRRNLLLWHASVSWPSAPPLHND